MSRLLPDITRIRHLQAENEQLAAEVKELKTLNQGLRAHMKAVEHVNFKNQELLEELKAQQGIIDARVRDIMDRPDTTSS